MKRIKKLLILLIVFQLIGCKMKTFTLQNGITKVPVNPNVYNNKSKFDNSLLSIVDTTAIYEEYSIENNILCRIDDDVETRFYGAIRFYSNGCFNYFTLYRVEQIDTNSFNPQFDGNRGVYFKEKNKIRGEFYGRINGMGKIGRISEEFSFNGDTLFVNFNLSELSEVYIKRKLPANYLNYNANW